MADIEITRPHGKSHEEARQVAETVAKKLAASFDMSYSWSGDTMKFERSGLSGQLDVGPDDLVLTAKLGMLLKPLKPKIVSEINKFLDEKLA